MISKVTTTEILEVLGNFQNEHQLKYLDISNLLENLSKVKANESFSESINLIKREWNAQWK